MNAFALAERCVHRPCWPRLRSERSASSSEEGRTMSERRMVKAGGPCQGPGKLPNTGPTTSQSFWRAAAQYIMCLAPSRSALCRTSPSTSSTAQRSCSTSLMTSATGLAALPTTSNVQQELRGGRLRSSHALWGGWVGWVWDGRPRDRAALVHVWSCYGSSLACRVAFCPIVVARHRALKRPCKIDRRIACVTLTFT